MKDGLCSKQYPKRFDPETKVNDGGYPQYRRRQTFPLRTVKKGILDTRSVVPHNLGLLEMFDCHLNVEVCTSVRAVKYLYKYTYKGPDRACLDRQVDEVQQFLDSRYCGAPEACWRLFAFPLQGRSHTVERLPVHLPLHQNVLFTRGAEQSAVQAAMSRPSKLEASFLLNAKAESFDASTCALILSLRYPNIPRHFSWDSTGSCWKPRRKRGKVLIVIFIEGSASAQSMRPHFQHSLVLV